MSRKHRGHLLVLFFVAIGVLAALHQAHGLTVDRILAIVDNELVTFTDYQRFTKGLGVPANSGDVDELLLKRIVEEKIILLAALRKGIEVSDREIDGEVALFMESNALTKRDLDVVLAKEGMDIVDYRRLLKDKIRSAKLIHDEVESRIAVTEREIAEYYAEHRRQYLLGPEKVEVKAFFLRLDEGASISRITELKRTALKIHEELRESGSFESLASRYFDQGIAQPEAIMGDFARGELLPPLERKAFSMNKGEVSEPIWVKSGVYILKLLNRTEESFKPIEKVRDEIHAYLYEKKKQELLNEWMRALWQQASVTIVN